MKLALAILALTLLAGTARADQVWNYAGNSTSGQSLGQTPLPANACGCALDGTVVFANPLVFGQSDSVVSFSFTDGAYTFNNTNSVLAINPFTFSNMPLDTWFFSVHTLDGSLAFFSQRYDNYEATDYGIGGLYVQANHGIWTDPVSAPEPSIAALLLFGMLGLGCLGLIWEFRKLQWRVRDLEAKVWEPLA